MNHIKNKIGEWMGAFTFVALLCISGISCSSDDSTPDPELIVAKDELSFSKEGGMQKLAIKTNISWSVSSSESWCVLSPTSGEAGTKQIEVTVPTNPGTDVRNAYITVTVGSLSEQVQIKQLEDYVLNIQKKDFNAATEGEDIIVEYQSSGAPEIIIHDEWISQIPARAVSNGKEAFKIESNLSLLFRVGTITFQLNDITETVTITQTGTRLSIPADKTGMESDAPILAKKITLGWNLGNSLEAYNDGIPSETGWGNPKTTKAMINAVKAAGFNAVRIPCAWDGYIVDQSTYQISDTWLARVKEVVDYCVTNDMYAIINIHWDGGWLENNPTYDKQQEVNAKQKALWEQIAVYFRDYDEHLLFAGTNEVHEDYNAPSAENIAVQLSYNQTFVDAVRSTGGRNSWRNLIVQAYNTNIDLAITYLKDDISTDPTANRLMVEVHYYDPYGFCLDETGTEYLWGSMFAGSPNVSNWGQEDYMDETFGKMKTNFVDRGYPVILGEYAPMRRTNLTGESLDKHNTARAYYLEYVTKQAKKNGMVPFYWDNGGTGNHASGLFNRNTNEVADQMAVDALIRGAASGSYPF